MQDKNHNLLVVNKYLGRRATNQSGIHEEIESPPPNSSVNT
jgi:hypothetical protein